MHLYIILFTDEQIVFDLKRTKRVHVNPNFSIGSFRCSPEKNLESIYVLTSSDVRLFYKMKWLPCTDPEKFSKVGGRGVLCIYSVILLCKRKKIDFLGGFRTPPPSDPPSRSAHDSDSPLDPPMIPTPL